jgi:hypothetical protein
MITGLHSRKKASNQEDGFDPEVPKSPSSVGGDDEIKTHGRKKPIRSGLLLKGEIGCAIEAVIGFLIFGLFLGFLILHHQQRKVRFLLSTNIRTTRN